jgi:hypothetical protein
MIKALFKTYKADTTSASQQLPFDLAGEWTPTQHDKWYNRLPGKHSQRARASSTKMTYDSNGKGSGWVGEVFVDVQARSIAPGQYTAKFRVHASSKTLPWSANDGRMTLLEDGTLQVQYPSHGIREYWMRRDGCGAQIFREAHDQHLTSMSGTNSTCEDEKENNGGRKILVQKRRRTIKLLFRHFGNSIGAKKDGYFWHWGLGIDDSIYEVNGLMAVMGPQGIVAASSPFMKPICTNLDHFHGYLDLPETTRKTNEEIEEFSRCWVKLHPVYRALGPNCQTYSRDLFTFLTGEDLHFANFADKVVGPGGNSISKGPESDPNAVWLNPSKKPASGS